MKFTVPLPGSLIRSARRAGGHGHRLVWLICGLQLASLVHAAAIFDDANDAEVQFTLSTPPFAIADPTSNSLISGSAGTGGKERCPVLPFQLPDFGAVTNPFLTASFTFNYASKVNTVAGNVDVYGLDRRDSPLVLTNDYWTATNALDPNATFLDGNLITVNSTAYGLKTTTASGGSNLLAYLNAQYASGAGAGQFVFLRLSTDAAQSGVSRYQITAAEGAAAATNFSIWPQINYTAKIPLGDPVATIRVETRADGAGLVVPATNLLSGASLTGYAIARNGGGAFLSNTPASWGLTNVVGSVGVGNLTVAPDGRSAGFTASGTGSSRILASGNATNLVPSGVITVTPGTNLFTRPFIWVRDSERAAILAKIATNAWAASVFNGMIARVASHLASYQSDRDAFLRQLPIDWTLPKPTFFAIDLNATEAQVRGPTESKFNDALDCAVLFYLTGNTNYAQCAADILHNAVQGLQLLPVSTSVGNGGWLFQTDFLKEARVTGTQLPIIYDFLYQYLAAGNQVYDVASGGMVDFSFPAAQYVFRTLYQTARDHGQTGSNWSSLMAPCMVNSILALDDPTERTNDLQVYLVTGSSRQQSLKTDAQNYVVPGNIWPESLQYASAVGNNDTCLMVMLERYDPSLQLFNAYPNLPLSLSRISYLRYPNGQQISFGDGHRDTDGQPFFEYEIVYRHALDRGRTNLTALYGSLLNGGIANGEYNRATLDNYSSLGRHDEPKQLLLFAPTIPEPGTPLVLPQTDTLPYAGIALQRNPSTVSNSIYGLMGFVGGAAHVHSHACGMNIELYGLGQVLGAKSGRTTYGAPDNEDYYRVFASDNTIVVNGASRGLGGWGGFGINTVQVVAMEPQPFQAGVSSNFSFTCSSFADTMGTLAEGTQQRTLAIIRTSPTNGYYVDLFRSKSSVSNQVATTLAGNVTNQFHDYIYRNVGDTLSLTINGATLPLIRQPARFQNDIGDANQQPGWRYFTNTEVSYPINPPVLGQFKATPAGTAPLYMDLRIPGVANREYAKVSCPAIVDAPAPYDSKLATALVMRQIGDAWDRPFAVVYEPHFGPTNGSVQNVATLERSNVVVGLKVQSQIGSRSVVQYVISNPNANETYADPAIGLTFTGRFGVVTDHGDGTTTFYLGNGASLSYRGNFASCAGGTNTQAEVRFAPGLAPIVTANARMNVVSASAPAFAQVAWLANGILSVTATGATGVPYRLWGGTNLSVGGWSLLSSGSVTNSPFTLQDLEATNFSARYYRFSMP